MADLATLTKYLQDSITTPMLQSDPVYLALITTPQGGKSGITSIVEQTIRFRGYTVATLPQEEEEYVVLLAKKEVYMRLATTVAPEYDVETQYTKMLRATRFEHYIALVNSVQKDITALTESGQFNYLQYADVMLSKHDGTVRNYNLSLAQTVTLTASQITSNSVALDWTMYDVTIGRFAGYEIYVSTQSMYDAYEVEPFTLDVAEQSFMLTDIKRTKLRVSGLQSATKYYILIMYRSNSGSVDALQIEATTLA